MEFLRLGIAGSEIPVVRESGVDFDLRPIAREIDGFFLANDGIQRTREALAAGTLPKSPMSSDARVGSPIARPEAILCIGQNYAAHAAETGDPPPVQPILFHKHPNTIVGAYDNIHRPRDSQALDWEVELGVVIGKRARFLGTVEDALACVAGYVVSNDVSERDFQISQSGGQWSKGKNSETFNPLGPVLVPADEVDPHNLRMWSRVNGEIRQDSNTADMIFNVAFIVHHLSQYMVLEPGDLVNTGTPQGVALSGKFPYLKDGDVVEVGIDGLGTQRQVVVAAPR
ncbi:fumarylacetoacetate hydrolase family protein [Alpinimonas psychrophila]|uniref:2-keto-4-pentenoate hydratase/2-oxohepta-3-ene-1,7-dioic acid hydratase in catechol pathway n=1 Tax=Alpinimonas psychrophila TaxID=748908 RepID=A0A7W3JTJ7_9MICO|nr:fumarylacetoacetate hydrolase family protein [Alpinimonas psychrophila]MBA8828925.1 2-keto-4-pentenoate hydratase/2-oxohepta-3-ene-1,7-dioic acid hydratase in catechol pathway [Alpinimonas psychrophila]